MSRNKRINFLKRQLWVEPIFQKEATWFFLFAAFLGMLSFVGAWMILGIRFFGTLAVIVDSVSEETRLQLFDAWNQIFMISVLFAAFFCGGLVILGLFFTNRVAGPIFRIDQDLKKMLGDNDFRQIKTRKTDFFKDHVDTVNLIIERVLDSQRKD